MIRTQLRALIDNGPKDEAEKFLKRVYEFIGKQEKIIKEQQRQTRFKHVLDIGTENLELHARIKELELDRNTLKQAYDALTKAI
ncbi:hypothetical protein [Niallia sp. 03091]|uniref:hypothetical protein n=1 Tax=Niallia sp. 03091 TaxID=3458059 RepID=UPI004043F6D0